MIAPRHRTPVALALMGTGVAVAVLGYLGVAKETEVAFQLPYFASGAVGALLLFNAGAVLLLSTQLGTDTSRLDELEDAVRAMAAELGHLVDSTPPVDPSAPLRGNGRRHARPARRARSVDLDGDAIATRGDPR